MRLSVVVTGVVLGAVAAASAMVSHQVGLFDGPARTKIYVVYSAEAQNVPAGKRSVLELRFRVVNGFHVNSHTPKSELLIPTNLALQPAAGVKAEAAEYPAGMAYSLSADPSEKLDVYTGDFTVKVPVVAEAGAHTIDGTLKYQACDHASCYPPRSLPVQVIFSAK
ncbi:MAG: protein-disulfide reductase DsbD domain-containing protein [Edaphobacter sp.]